ncbi:HAMP domain-containing sensor histidine kinase [Pseudogracilibacillus sp. SO30301A]|uniref:HAMP domain-containing sensor histidine kinase n=1 Tax=Pseudogracilibacillus sp. SO30301A TaxID=3098291 RepID=UPI00300E6554
MKLKTKIQLFSSLFMLLFIMLVNTSIYFLFYKISVDNELELLSDQTRTIMETMKENPDIPKTELLRAYLPNNGLIRIIDEKDRELIPIITKQKEFRELPSAYSTREVKEIVRDETGSPIAVIRKPIIWENGEIVTLQVANYLFPLEETMRTLLYVLVAASIIMLIPTIIAGNFLSKFILRPIKELISTMKDNTKSENWKTIEIENKSKDELYEMEKTFNEMIAHLKENFERQEVFVSDASHELKTPISIIKSYAELLKRRGKSHPEVFEESIDAIDTEADRMQQLVNQLLDLAKNKQSAPSTELDLVKLTKNVIHTFQAAYERDIYFKSEVDTILIKGNEDQLEQIIYILLSNAIKYSEKEINIVLTEQKDTVKLRVVDKGLGIRTNDQKRIFDRFYRVDQARTRTSGGIGLGLAIAKAISEAHNGSLTVNSEEGKGTTFTLELPIMKKS